MTSAARDRVRDRIPALLREYVFRRFWSAQTASYFGEQVTIVALPLVAVLALDADAAQMGYLTAASTLPYLFLSLHIGAFVDRRGRRRRTMIAAEFANVVVLLSVPIAYWLGIITLVQLYVVAFVAGTSALVYTVCAHSLFGSLVRREDYLSGNSLTKGSYSFSWVAGPSLGGGLVQLLSAPAAIFGSIAASLGSAFLLKSIYPDEPPGESSEGGRIREGLRFVRKSPSLLANFSAGTALNFFYSVYFALLFLYAVRELELAAGVIGFALSAGAVGALLGAVVTSTICNRIGVGPTLVIGSFLYPAALFLVPLASGDVWVAATLLIIAEFASGVGLMMCDISGTSVQLALTPERMRSLVQGSRMALTQGARPLGALAGGTLGTWLGLRPTLWVAAIGGTLSVLLLLPSPLPRMRELPDTHEAA